MVGESVGWLEDLNMCFEFVRTVDLLRPEAATNIGLNGSERS